MAPSEAKRNPSLEGQVACYGLQTALNEQVCIEISMLSYESSNMMR